MYASILRKYVGITSIIALRVIPSNGTGPFSYLEVLIDLSADVLTPNILASIPGILCSPLALPSLAITLPKIPDIDLSNS